jgi:RNA-directed DNA polymerase
VTYFRHASGKAHLQRLDEWIRRKLRCVRLKQRKRSRPLIGFLLSLGVPLQRAVGLGRSRRGWWRMAGSPQAAEAMSLRWFQELGLLNLTERYLKLQH